jgi:uncharacterized protein YdiU (UPF0061 family)
MNFLFDNSYARELPECYVAWQPERVPAPRLLFFNHDLAQELQLALDSTKPQQLAEVFSGNQVPHGAKPIAQVYAGHQFGHFSPQLGDGRALLLGEVLNRQGQRYDIAFKGSGRTPFSRRGDGKAAVGPMLREALMGEAMHALGVPTTRALAVVATGESVYRERTLPGAVLTRVAASHLRVGTFEYFAARGEFDRVRQLTDYAMARHEAALVAEPDRYLKFFSAVAQRQAKLLAQWMQLGFIHGVMNTDNMSISGETIDYGPCAFMEAYDPQTVFSSIDHQGRYAYGNQPLIARWNLARFGETLLPLIHQDEARAVEQVTEIINTFPAWFEQHWWQLAQAKLGVRDDIGYDTGMALVQDWLMLLQQQHVDWTLAWRRLSDAAAGQPQALRKLFAANSTALDQWLSRWQAFLTADSSQRMYAQNPIIIPRNHRVEEALIAASDQGDLAPFNQLLEAIRQPYEEHAKRARYAEPAPFEVTEKYQTFCGT